jgi:hypothetical protein
VARILTDALLKRETGDVGFQARFKQHESNRWFYPVGKLLGIAIGDFPCSPVVRPQKP